MSGGASDSGQWTEFLHKVVRHAEEAAAKASAVDDAFRDFREETRRVRSEDRAEQRQLLDQLEARVKDSARAAAASAAQAAASSALERLSATDAELKNLRSDVTSLENKEIAAAKERAKIQADVRAIMIRAGLWSLLITAVVTAAALALKYG